MYTLKTFDNEKMSPPPQHPHHRVPLPFGSDKTNVLYALPKIVCACSSTVCIHPFLHNREHAICAVPCLALFIYLSPGWISFISMQGAFPLRISLCLLRAYLAPIDGHLGGFQSFAPTESVVG